MTMKKTMLACVLALLAVAAAANPVIPRAVARVWFDASDNFIVLFGADFEQQTYLNYLPYMTFTTSSGTYSFPAGFTPPSSLPWMANFNQLIPGFTIDRNEDHFILQFDYLYECLYWSPESGSLVNIRPLSEGQSAVQLIVAENELYSWNAWAKDSSTTGPDPFTPSEGCQINVHVSDQNGDPVAGTPVYWSYTNTINPIYPPGQTGADGTWQLTQYALRTLFQVNDPHSGGLVLNETVYPEPGQTYDLYAVVNTSASDPVQTPSAGILSLNPSVLKGSDANVLNVKYASPSPLSVTGELRLYDLRGRYLARAEIPACGETRWDLPVLDSGIYFVTLCERGQELARGRFTLIK